MAPKEGLLTKEPQPARKKANSILALLTPTWLEGPCLEWAAGSRLWRAGPRACVDPQGVVPGVPGAKERADQEPFHQAHPSLHWLLREDQGRTGS